MIDNRNHIKRQINKETNSFIRFDVSSVHFGNENCNEMGYDILFTC